MSQRANPPSTVFVKTAFTVLQNCTIFYFYSNFYNSTLNEPTAATLSCFPLISILENKGFITGENHHLALLLKFPPKITQTQFIVLKTKHRMIHSGYSNC